MLFSGFPLFVLLLLSTFSFAQQQFSFRDAGSGNPIANVYVFDPDNELVAISNVLGEVTIEGMKAGKYTTRHLSYHPFTFQEKQPERLLYLEPLVADLEELVVSGMTNEDLYNRILENSRRKVTRKNGRGKMTYYMSTYYIVEDTAKGTIDTAILNTRASFNFNVEVNGKGKRSYTFFADQSARHLSKFHVGDNGVRYEKTMAMMKNHTYFDALFEYELSSNDRFRLPGGDHSSARFRDSVPRLEFYKDKKRGEGKLTAYYTGNDSTLVQYENYWKYESLGYSLGNAAYDEKDGLYFLRMAAGEYRITFPLPNLKLTIFNVGTLLVDELEGISETVPFYTGDFVKPESYIKQIPIGEEPVPVLMKPVFGR